MLAVIILTLLGYLTTTLAGFPSIQTTEFVGLPENWQTDYDGSPFIKIGSKFYFVEAHKKANWFEAAHACRTLNANLATIESAAEFEAITTHLASHPYDQRNYYWLAANDLGQEGKFCSIGTGLPITYANWSRGNPDNTKPGEHCAHIWMTQGTFTMNDLGCKEMCNYICQANNPRTISFTIW